MSAAQFHAHFETLQVHWLHRIRTVDVSKPILYIKRGCPYCEAAIRYLDEQGIDYETIDVYRNQERTAELEKLSGQTRTPTLKWNGDVLADFGVEDLRPWLAERRLSRQNA